jgi:LacI family transcriptional regulator
MALTIRDIAKLAGVSRGTVDRVLHNRGRVDPEVEQRIKAIVRECNYQPSRAAQQLSMRKQKLRIGFVCRIDQNGFWSIVIRSADKAEQELAEYGITIEKRYFDYCQPETQLEMINELVALDISALVIVPLDDPLIRQRLQELSDQGIVVILLQSEISGFSPFCYIGSDYYIGGRTAAGLLHNFTAGRPAKILLLNGSKYLSSHRLRRSGFLDELNTYHAPHELIESGDITSDPEYAYHQARK